VSLVQEPLIGVLNRRFVFCFFNSFNGPGGDAAASAFFKEHGGKGYGAIFTPDGKCLSSFGYNMTDVYRALKNSSHQSPEHWLHTEQEKAVLLAAKNSPDDLQAQLAVARLHMELLDFASAAQVLDAYSNRVTDDRDKAVVAFWKAHYLLAENDLETQQYKRAWDAVGDEKKLKLSNQREVLLKELVRLEGKLPEELEDDRVVDLIGSRVRLRQARGFYTGWQFPADEDKADIAKSLDVWIKKAPASNRIGQMHFLRGLAYADDGKMKSADEAWKWHIETYPADRFAMLSRFHHSSYQFSPYAGGRGPRVSGRRGKKLSKEEVDRILKRLKPES